MSNPKTNSAIASTETGQARISRASSLGSWATLRRGFQLSPEIARGLGLTLLLAIGAAVGRIVVPLTVQQVVDEGILAAGGPDLNQIFRLAGLALLTLVFAGLCSSAVNFRLVSRTEAGLATLRLKTFRHIHDLSALTQNTERKGALVSRVTSDIDTITQFMQWGGIMLVVASLQLIVASVLMLVFSWQLALVVWACFIPLFLIFRYNGPRVRAAYARVREQTGTLLGAISESVVGAETVRAYGAGPRTMLRINDAIEQTRAAQGRAQLLVASTFTAGNLTSNLALAAVVIIGTRLGIAGHMTAGQVVAFLFLVQLFTGPVQLATEILNEFQNALAGWRRVIAVLETPIDVPDPANPVELINGPGQISFNRVNFAYPDGDYVLSDVNLDLPARKKIAIVGHTGSGKTTLAKLACRLMDPSNGIVTLDGVDLRKARLADLRRRIVLVPQEGFLFDGTIAQNVAYGARPTARVGGHKGTSARSSGIGAFGTDSLTDDEVVAAFTDLGLADWLTELPNGIQTEVGQRGESLSAGERQLVALVRASVTKPELLVLDEATSAVDPATEVRIARALERLTAGRTTLTIAHRLATAEAADLVVVVDQGRVAQVGTCAELLARPGVFAEMYQAWQQQISSETSLSKED